ncbi:hypothetical protein QBC35DRAFT_461956 [Podospora australis]|uniref:Uncharacterized protein n=1 Tax=Podospora australis TaxID=1536484 RepID=A0AAN7AKI4_9PEZI|nr:hypothetical protein QBC35DRAFT_461956 [Podospora australis]
MAGTLVPPWYEPNPPSEQNLDLASFFWGFSMAIAGFSLVKAASQTRRSWIRNHKLNAYIVMVWSGWVSAVILSVISWLFLIGHIRTCFWVLLGMVILWAIQLICLTQILANRISLILFDPDYARRLKIGVGIAIGLIIISVCCIWIPARLQISETWERINSIWDRIEKGLFLIIDAGLNIYFMWLVRTKLLANGLTKYKVIYHFNWAMVCMSISLDVVLIGVMFLDDDLIYVQVHPVTSLAKLCVEMNMAELLGKVIKKSRQRQHAFPTANPMTIPWQPEARNTDISRPSSRRGSRATTVGGTQRNVELQDYYHCALQRPRVHSFSRPTGDITDDPSLWLDDDDFDDYDDRDHVHWLSPTSTRARTPSDEEAQVGPVSVPVPQITVPRPAAVRWNSAGTVGVSLAGSGSSTSESRQESSTGTPETQTSNSTGKCGRGQ